jgi:hypothetical protein
MPDPDEPDVGIGVLGQKVFRGGQGRFIDGKRAGVHVDGDDLASVSRFDLSPDLPLIDLVAASGGFLG